MSDEKPKLGLATTRELLNELTARIDVLGQLDYRTTDGLASGSASEGVADETPARVLPEGKRVVRTKSSGDRVYLLDEVKKTRQWITNPDVLTALGFESTDVTEIDDSELLKFQMAAAIQRVDG